MVSAGLEGYAEDRDFFNWLGRYGGIVYLVLLTLAIGVSAMSPDPLTLLFVFWPWAVLEIFGHHYRYGVRPISQIICLFRRHRWQRYKEYPLIGRASLRCAHCNAPIWLRKERR